MWLKSNVLADNDIKSSGFCEQDVSTSSCIPKMAQDDKAVRINWTCHSGLGNSYCGLS